MESTAAAAAPADPGAASGAAAPAPSLMATLRELWNELPGLLNDRIELLSLELQRAGAALVQVVMLVVAAAILGVTAWLVLWAAIVWALATAGLHPTLALGAVLLVNVGAAWWAMTRARRLLPMLRLPATLRHLMLSPSPTPRDDASPRPQDERSESRQPVAS